MKETPKLPEPIPPSPGGGELEWWYIAPFVILGILVIIMTIVNILF